MNRKDLEYKINNDTDPSEFQRLCDSMLTKEGYKVIPYGTKEGKKVVRKGTPDSYIVNQNDKTMTFVEYTTQSSDLKRKVLGDIKKCIDKAKEFSDYSLKEILFFINNNNIDPSVHDKALIECKKFNVDIKIYSLSDICNYLYRHKSIVKSFFNEDLTDDSFLSLEDFVEYTKSLNGVDHSYEFIERDEDEKKIAESIEHFTITVLNGEAGVGKSMLAVQALKKANGTVWCVRKNNEDSLDYLSEFIQEDRLLYLFLDDVNEIGSFKRFLDGLRYSDAGKVKVICTVRSYALQEVESAIVSHSFQYNVLRVNRLSDEAIEKILDKNLGIKNERWLKKISEISKGNPRLALMAGKVAIKNGVEKLIDSKDILKKYFEISTSGAIKQLLDRYHNVLGFISFLKNIDIENLSEYAEILALFQITKKEVKDSIFDLRSAEIISLYEERVAQIDDQNLSDYILERELIEYKCCHFSDLIIKLLKTKKGKIVESLNIILNIYSNKTSRQYVESEISKAWEKMENTEYYDSFVRVFYPFKVEKALIYYKSKIEKHYTLFSGDYNQYEKNYHRNDDVDTLANICRHFNNATAFQLLLLCLDYKDIRNAAFSSLVSFASLDDECFTEEGIVNDMIFLVKDSIKKPWFNHLLYSLLNEGLKYYFEFTNMNNEGKLNIYSLELNDAYPGLISYRQKLWELSLLLDDDCKYRLVYSLKEKHPGTNCKETFREDIKMANTILEGISSRNALKEQLFKVNMLTNLSQCGLGRKDLKICSENELEKLIFILDPADKRFPYEERKDRHSKKVEEYGKNADINELKQTLKLCDEIIAASPGFAYKTSEFLQLLLYGLTKDKLAALLEKTAFDNFSDKTKRLLLDANYQNGNKGAVFSYLSAVDKDPSMIEATFTVFGRIKDEDINDETREHFSKCLALDLKTEGCGSGNTDMLYRFSKTDEEFVNTICSLISIANDNFKKFHTWVDLLFNEHRFKSEYLVSMFNKAGRIKELEKIVLIEARKSADQYSLHKYVYKIAQIDSSFVEVLAKKLTDYKESINPEIFSELWEQANSSELANIIFDTISKNRVPLSFFPLGVKRVFVGHRNNERFLKWSIAKLEKLNDSEPIKVLTEIVSECSAKLVYQYYLKLVKKQIDKELFRDLLSYPHLRSWSGSEENAILPKIEKMKQILSSIPDELNYLEYKAVIDDCINEQEEYLKSVRIRERLYSNEDFK